MFGNYTLGFCFWDLPTAILLVAVVISLVIQQQNHKKKMDELRQPINDFQDYTANSTVDSAKKPDQG